MKHKRLIPGALLAGLALAAAYHFQSNDLATAAPSAPPPIPQAPVAQVVIQPVAASVELTGTITPVEDVQLRARISGFVERVAFTEGSLVRKGQVLFQLDPRPFHTAVQRARAELARTSEQETLARTELERGEKLVPSGVISPSRYDALRAAAAQTRAASAAARAALRTAEVDLGYTRVTSPIDGRAGRAIVKAGNLVSGGTDGATLLTTIVAVDPVHVSFDVDEPTYSKLSRQRHEGQLLSNASIAIGMADDDGFPHLGTLDFLGNALDPSSGTAEARAILTNADGRFAPGLFARVRFAIDRPRDTVLISDRTIGTDQQGRYVLVVDGNNIVEQRRLDLGGTWDGLRIVRSGLAAGDRVVMGGMVRPGMKIEPRPVEMIAEASRASGRAR